MNNVIKNDGEQKISVFIKSLIISYGNRDYRFDNTFLALTRGYRISAIINEVHNHHNRISQSTGFHYQTDY